MYLRLRNKDKIIIECDRDLIEIGATELGKFYWKIKGESRK